MAKIAGSPMEIEVESFFNDTAFNAELNRSLQDMVMIYVLLLCNNDYRVLVRKIKRRVRRSCRGCKTDQERATVICDKVKDIASLNENTILAGLAALDILGESYD